MAGVFISYRRGDSSGYAGWLREHLTQRFGHDRVFMDVDTIEPGSDFVQAIEGAVASCDVLLALIGDEWLSPRLEDPRDFVRMEIAAALRRGIRVIPVLLERMEMPPEEALPDDLRALTRRQALPLSHARFRHDAGQLVDALERIVERGPAKAEPPADLPDAPPGYRIEAVLHESELGTLYRAVQIGLDRPVALRLVAGDQAADPAFRERFLREAKVVAALHHPNILGVYDAGVDETRAYVASVLVEGRSLWRVLRDEGRLAPERVGRVLAQVADGLHAAHERGVVHTNVNLMMVLVEDGSEHAYVTGFGFSPFEHNRSLTSAGNFFATPAYISPELIHEAGFDRRSDVYSLGCVLFHLLTRKVPFKRASVMATLWAHLNDPIPSLRELVPEVPPAYDAVIAKAAAKDPADRFATAAELAAALRSL